MTDKLFLELCKLGNDADVDYSKGKIEEAFENYNQILGTMLEIGSIDSFLVSKATLGIMLSFIVVRQLDEAFKIWRSGQDSMYSIGIDGLENGQVSVRDTILYLQVCAYLQSHSNADKETRADRVCSLYKRICIFTTHESPESRPVMISNWELLLRGLYDGKIPENRIKLIKSVSEEEIHPIQSVIFLQPSRWEITWDDE